MFQKDAIVHLLRDNDPETVSLLKEQLVEGGADAIPALEDLLRLDDARVTAHVREVLDEIGVQQAHEEMALFAHLFPENGDLEEACWLLSRCFHPGVDVPKCQRKLEAWARRLKMLLEAAPKSSDQLRVLTSFLADELGFRGNNDEYYDVSNSLLSDVIENRLGIPISLSVLYIVLGKRAGLEIEGINLPGHFIARHAGTYFDPFHQGRLLSHADCEAILARQKLKSQPSYFAPASARLIFTRMLANLLFIFERAGDDATHQQVLQWLRALDRK